MLCSRLFRRSRLLCTALGLALLSPLGLGCQSGEVSPPAVARVGDYTLTQADLERRLEGLGTERDSAARAQIIEQWVRRTLLYREAERRDLATAPAVQRRLERQRRSVLVAELTTRLYDDASLRPSDAEVRTYFERHKASLRLREPYVRVRYLPAADRAAAVAARQALADLPPTADSAWTALVRRTATDTARAQRLSQQPLSERRLAQQIPFDPEALRDLQAGDTAPLLQADGQYHVLRLDRRRPAGAQPNLAWVAPQIRQRLRIRARKQIYTNEVERLRSQAQARGLLTVR